MRKERKTVSRLFALLLTLAMLLSLPACGSAAVEKTESGYEVTTIEEPAAEETAAPTEEPEPTPEPTFAEAQGLIFEAPHAVTKKAQQISTLERAKYNDVYASIEPPVIYRTVIENEGGQHARYMINAKASAGVDFVYPAFDGKEGFRYKGYFDGYFLYDSYTGIKFPDRVLNTHENDTDSFDYTTMIEYQGKEYPVAYSQSIIAVWDEGAYESLSGNRTHFSRNASVLSVYTVEVPADYDGLILGISTAGTKEKDDPWATEEEIDDSELHYWHEVGDEEVGDWTFIRVCDYAQDMEDIDSMEEAIQDLLPANA